LTAKLSNRTKSGDERADAEVEEQACFGSPLPGWPSMKAPVTGSEKSVESARITAACAVWSTASDALPRRNAVSSMP
jgi:hypothetical protein